MRYTATILFILFSMTTFAQQCNDILIYDSNIISINYHPLEKLLKSDSIINNRILKNDSIFGNCSNCWRGFIATWEIQNDSLFLTDLKPRYGDCIFDLDWIFGKKIAKNSKVFADWYSGVIIGTLGHKLGYDNKDIIHTDIDINILSNILSCKFNCGHITDIEIVTINIFEEKDIDPKFDNEIYELAMLDSFPVLITPERKYKMNDLLLFIEENTKYPQNGEDSVVCCYYILFVVEKDGTINNKELWRNPRNKEAMKAMEIIDLMTNWKPGIKNDNPVRTRVIIPIKYKCK